MGEWVVCQPDFLRVRRIGNGARSFNGIKIQNPFVQIYKIWLPEALKIDLNSHGAAKRQNLFQAEPPKIGSKFIRKKRTNVIKMAHSIG
jgi:hypothetical protein